MSEHETPRTDEAQKEALALAGLNAWVRTVRMREVEIENADLRAKLDAARVAIEPLLYSCRFALDPENRRSGDADGSLWADEVLKITKAALAQIDTTISPPDTQSKNT